MMFVTTPFVSNCQKKSSPSQAHITFLVGQWNNKVLIARFHWKFALHKNNTDCFRCVTLLSYSE